MTLMGEYNMNRLTFWYRAPRRVRVHKQRSCFAAIVLFSLGLLNVPRLFAADFSVASPGFSYTINASANNPTLTLVRGRTYTFAVNTSSIHPFLIQSTGVSNNNINQGTITFTVPNVASNYTYICSIHFFGGQILTVPPPPPPPPTIKILSLSVSSNIVMRSTGTNTWSVIPEYKTNIIGTNWFALTVVSNFFSSGTNETICGLPPSEPAFLRIRSQAK